MATTDDSTDVLSRVDIDDVVDVGAQVQEDVDDFLPFMDENTAAREFVDLSGGPRTDVYGGPSAYPFYDYKRAEDGEIVEDGPITETIAADAVGEMQDDYGIGKSVVNPTLNLGIPEINNDRFALGVATGYNEWLLDQLEGHDSLVGNMVIAPQHPERAAEEIERLADEDSIVGVNFPITGLTPPAGHRSYNPVYEAAENNGLPVTLQPTVGLKSFHQQFFDSDYFAEDAAYHQPFLTMQHLASIMFEGVPERYPDVDFVLLDAGIGWAPYLAMRMDDHYLELGYEIPALEKLPGEYLKDSFYWGTAPMGDQASNPTNDYVAKMIRMTGVDNVLYASDLPHPIGSDSPAAVAEALSPHFDDEEIEKIMSGNAADVYDL